MSSVLSGSSVDILYYVGESGGKYAVGVAEYVGGVDLSFDNFSVFMFLFTLSLLAAILIELAKGWPDK